MTDQKNDKKTTLYEALHCDSTEESSYATISIHRTLKGAEEAIQIHAAEELAHWEENYKGSYSKFGRWADWTTGTIELED